MDESTEISQDIGQRTLLYLNWEVPLLITLDSRMVANIASCVQIGSRLCASHLTSAVHYSHHFERSRAYTFHSCLLPWGWRSQAAAEMRDTFKILFWSCFGQQTFQVVLYLLQAVRFDIFRDKKLGTQSIHTKRPEVQLGQSFLLLSVVAWQWYFGHPVLQQK